MNRKINKDTTTHRRNLQTIGQLTLMTDLHRCQRKIHKHPTLSRWGQPPTIDLKQQNNLKEKSITSTALRTRQNPTKTQHFASLNTKTNKKDSKFEDLRRSDVGPQQR